MSKQTLFNMKLFDVHVPHQSGIHYTITIVADSLEQAQLICDVHGFTVEGEVVAIIDDNNGGEHTTLYSEDGTRTTDYED